VSRANLFEQGCFVLSRFGPSRARLSFTFDGENGIGDGPTQEFFTAIAKEFCKRETKCWRETDGGLFPAVTADTALLEVLGYLCAKAILMGKVLPVPFNPAFFKLVRGETVSVSEVDMQLAESLSYREGLYDLPFVYPGTDVELKPGGSKILVTRENVAQFVRLTVDFTTGRVMKDKIKYFVRAFETNIQKGTLAILTAEEISRVISGESVKITVEDLRQSVQIKDGYDCNCPEIQDFFKLFAEEMSDDEKVLLLRFTTGCSRLPCGGIQALNPPLTICLKMPEHRNSVDQCLPTAMTCAHTLRLPAYSNRNIMRKKILQAITECQDNFQFS
jgi:E3 ubiquitin-protein ligase TRIP12